MKKSAGVAIGIGIAVVIIGTVLGFSMYEESETAPEPVEETPTEPTPPEGKSIEINLSDSVVSKEAP